MPVGNDLPDPFSLPLKTLAAAQAVVHAIEALLAERQLGLRPPPPVPDSCCGRGCNGCVWQAYCEALAYWREQAATLLGLR
ncbi:MAG: oxidoreductase-like domain-containing protein [Rhodocyclaceae bacterium]